MMLKSGAVRAEASKGRVLVVEDEEILRDSLRQLLEAKGYEIAFAENGKDALEQLHYQLEPLPNESMPDIILLDLRMPTMDGWQFRAIQKDDPKLGLIPVIAFSADGSAQAAAISAQAYLRKPIEPAELITTIGRVLLENGRQMSERLDKSERLASLGRLAAGVGHEINNPLAFVMLNLASAIETLRDSSRPVDLESVLDMLNDCQSGGERIRDTVLNLQRLSRQGEAERSAIDLNPLIEQSVSMVWNQLRQHARVTKNLGKVPLIYANNARLGQVFLNLLINASQAIAEGDVEGNEICISTELDSDANELVVQVSDTGAGIAPEALSHVFEPFFTTKATGQGTGLGLSLSAETIADYGGRMTVESELGKGTVFRVFLPVAKNTVPDPSSVLATSSISDRGRVLVIDDEPSIGKVIRMTLGKKHEVVAVQCASAAISLFDQGENFDLILCDLVMPNMTGPELYTWVAERWPERAAKMVFMSGGAFTPGAADFLKRMHPNVLSKPFKIEEIEALLVARIKDSKTRPINRVETTHG